MEKKVFAIFAASRVFMRYRNNRQFEDGDKKRLKRVKSVLNYTKKLMYPLKLQFESENYAQNYNMGWNEDFPIINDFHTTIMSSIDSLGISDFNCYLSTITKTIKAFINSIPHKSNSELDNIYASCLVSLLNAVTLSNKNLKKFNELKKDNKLTIDQINKMYKQERDSSTEVYHIPTSRKDYIKVLTFEIMHLVATDLSYLLHDNASTESSIKNMMLSSVHMDLSDNSVDVWEDFL